MKVRAIFWDPGARVDFRRLQEKGRIAKLARLGRLWDAGRPTGARHGRVLPKQPELVHNSWLAAKPAQGSSRRRNDGRSPGRFSETSR